MTQKKVKHSTQIASEENRVIKENIRKSRLAASNEFEFKKLVRRQERFLNCSMEEKKESLIVTYEIQNLLPWTGIRHEKEGMTNSGGICMKTREQCSPLGTQGIRQIG